MKQLSTFFFAAFFSATVFCQTIVSTTPSNKNVILEEYTGINCNWCPDGHKIAAQIMANNPGRAWAINIHQGSFAPNSPQYKTDWANGLAGQYSISGYPCGTVNRGASMLSRGSWTSTANQLLSQPSPVNVAAQGTIDWTTRNLTLLVEVYYTGNAAQATNKLNVALLQNEIIGPQQGPGLFQEMVIGTQYKHMHMLRDLITGQWGVDVSPTTTGEFWSHTFEYKIPEYITYGGTPVTNVPVVLDDLEILVFIAENQKTILSGAQANITFVNLPDLNPRFTEVIQVPSDCSNIALASARIKNAGENPITSVEFSYTVGGGAPKTFVWNNRTINSNTADTIQIPIEVQLNQVQNVLVNLVKVNSVSVPVTSKSVNIKKEVTPDGEAAMKLIIRTDQYAYENSFKIFKPDGTVLLQGGPFNSGGAIEREFNFIPTVGGCYRVEIYDDYGDGMPGGFVKILNSLEEQIYYASGSFIKLTAMVPVESFIISATSGENGSISPTGDKEYIIGKSAVYTFTPKPNYLVDEVLVDGEPVNFENNKYTFTSIDKDYTIHVTFKSAPKYKITATAEGGGTITPDGETEYFEGESATYIFTPPAPNYWVDEVLVDGFSVEFEDNNYTFPAVDKDYTIHVIFLHFDGIKDVNGVTISIAPNPIDDKLFITGMYEMLEIFSSSGQILYTANGQPSVDVTNLSKGIYFVKIHSNGQICTYKIVKKKKKNYSHSFLLDFLF
jgi:hypothetical protein